jgi:hypothetical protein
MNKRWHELFAVVTPNLHDLNAVNIAVTLDAYVEKSKSTNRNPFGEIMEEKLAQDEIQYLKEMLKTYRRLKLKPTS